MTVAAFQTAKDLYDRGRIRDSLPYFQQALRDAPADVDVMYRSMLTLMAMRDYAGCARWLSELLPYVDDANTPAWMMAGFHYNLGVSYEASGQWEKAREQHTAALRYDPDAILPTIELGSLAYRAGQAGDGKRWHEKALTLPTGDYDTKPARAFVRLLHGDYLGGFADYESRWKLPQVLNQTYIPKDHWRWKGKDLDGKRIVVVCEQGIGDSIQMCRYLPLIEDRGGRVALIIQPSLARLMRHNFPSVDVVENGQPYRPARWWCSLMSLPYIFGTTLDAIPSADRPYLTVDPPKSVDGLVASIICAVTPNLRLGYVQRGNPLHMGDKDRSCHNNDHWATLFKTPGVEFVNLDEFALQDSHGCKDFADTAAVVQGLDAVVTIDSAVAHLAGAMGIRTLLIPPCAPEWRWGLGDKAPWYPAVEIYRRRHVDDWPETIQRVVAAL